MPTNPQIWGNVTALGERYDKYASDAYIPFDKSLQQIPCDTTPSAQYSLARTCTDCARAYKRWLCAVTLPRCDDISSDNPRLMPRRVDDPDTTSLFFSEKAFNPNNKSVPVSNSSRNPMIDSEIQPGPYKERLPCIDLCHQLVQSCPSALQFACPLEGFGLSYSYGKDPAHGNCNSLNPRDSGTTYLKAPSTLTILAMILIAATLLAG